MEGEGYQVPTTEERVRLWGICDGGMPLQSTQFQYLYYRGGQRKLNAQLLGRGFAPPRMGWRVAVGDAESNDHAAVSLPGRDLLRMQHI